MRRCTYAIAPLRPSPRQQRWASHRRDTLTKKALSEQVHAGLGEDIGGKPLRLDYKRKTVSTAAGELPISPILDPEWMQTRRRKTKEAPKKPEGRFRRKLVRNPFARALATPIRRCTLTETYLPRFFLQDLEAVKHPETGKTWLAPGSLAYDKVVPHYRPTQIETGANGTSNATEAMPAHIEAKQAALGLSGEAKSLRAPVVVYTLGSQEFLADLTPNHRRLSKLLFTRTGTTATATMRGAVYRSGMGDLILAQMRRVVTDVLITRANHTSKAASIVAEDGKAEDGGPAGPEPNKFIRPVQSWDEVKDVRRRACILWVPANDASTGMASTSTIGAETVAAPTTEYATLDVPNARYDRKMPVYDMRWLLGDEEVARLQNAIFDVDKRHGRVNGGAKGNAQLQQLGEGKVDSRYGLGPAATTSIDSASTGGGLYVLRYWPSRSMCALHLLLWRLHGYLAKNHIESARQQQTDCALDAD